MSIPEPSILKFLREKRKQIPANSSIENNSQLCDDDEGIDSILVDDVNTVMDNQGESKPQGDSGGLVDVAKDILGSNVSEKWLHMDQVEPEKLKWMKKSPSVQQSGVGLKGIVLAEGFP